MMIEFVWDSGFKRVYKKKILFDQKLKSKFEDTVKLFANNPFDPRLKTHKLSGTMNNPAASSGVSKTEYVFLNAASGGEFTLSD